MAKSKAKARSAKDAAMARSNRTIDESLAWIKANGGMVTRGGLAEPFKITAAGSAFRVAKLEKAGLIEKADDGSLHLTSKGNAHEPSTDAPSKSNGKATRTIVNKQARRPRASSGSGDLLHEIGATIERYVEARVASARAELIERIRKP